MANRTVIIAARLTRAQAAALRRLARAQVPRQTRSQFVAGLVQAAVEEAEERATMQLMLLDASQQREEA